MTGFFIRKAFYDGWDHVFQLVLLNTIILVVAVGGFFLAGLVSHILVLSVFIAVCAWLVEGIILVSISEMMANVANYKAFKLKDFFLSVKTSWLPGILLSFVTGFGILVFSVTIPYYLHLGNVFGVVLALLMFWFAVICILSMQWFLPIRSQLEKNFWKCLKKSFIIFFDNPGFSIFMLFYSIVLLALSSLLVLFIPGIAGLILAQNEAFRLRMYKYDWIEKHPELDYAVARKSIPWEELIAEDRETVGQRSFLSFIFPWHD